MKRRLWLWPLIASACLIIVFGVSKLTSVPIGSILGWGALSTLGVVAVMIGAMIIAGFAWPIASVLRVLLRDFVPNGHNLSWTLGIIGFCSILVGYILTARVWWSLFMVMVGFFMGYFAGEEYQRFSDLRKE